MDYTLIRKSSVNARDIWIAMEKSQIWAQYMGNFSSTFGVYTSEWNFDQNNFGLLKPGISISKIKFSKTGNILDAIEIDFISDDSNRKNINFYLDLHNARSLWKVLVENLNFKKEKFNQI